MSEKTNFWTQAISAMNGVIRFGGISADGKCTEAIKISAKDAHHRIVMEEDGDREGWTSVYTPGRFMVDANTNKNLKYDDGITIISQNGNILIQAPKGRIRFQAENIEFMATSEDTRLGNISFKAPNGDVDVVKCKNFKVREAGTITMESLGTIGLKCTAALTTISSIIKSITSRTPAYSKKNLN
tara:strand:- start:88 stop:642 length:555 start_codon:yes stop_codon:yes gene_type:complete